MKQNTVQPVSISVLVRACASGRTKIHFLPEATVFGESFIFANSGSTVQKNRNLSGVQQAMLTQNISLKWANSLKFRPWTRGSSEVAPRLASNAVLCRPEGNWTDNF